MKSKRIINKLLFIVLVLITVAICIFPIYILIKYSISDKASWVTMGKYPVPWWPFKPTGEMYTYFVKDQRFIQSAIFSAKIAFVTLGISLLIGVPASYILSKYTFIGKWPVLILFTIIRYIPDITSAMPIATLFNTDLLYSLPDTLRVAMAHSLLGMPYVVFICMGVFDTIPNDLEEQARTMGASRLYAFVRVILPIAIPGISAAAIYVFILSWNEFVLSYFVTTTAMTRVTPLPVLLQTLLGGLYAPSPVMTATLSVLISIPVILFTFIAQKKMVSGATAGAVK